MAMFVPIAMSMLSALSVIDPTLAKHVQLWYCIDDINQNMGKIMIALLGKVEKLQEHVA